mmetsp:Transcript_597/g.1143  ORF Transcript_597/g.1143 Transcript_597/m.1143 type:complete len:253 (+) Transcript_597:176-934(+)
MEPISSLNYSLKRSLVQILSLAEDLPVLVGRLVREPFEEEEGLDSLRLSDEADGVDSSSRLVREDSIEDESGLVGHEVEHQASHLARNALEAGAGLELEAKLAHFSLVALNSGVDDAVGVLFAEHIPENLGLVLLPNGADGSDALLKEERDYHPSDLRGGSGDDAGSGTEFLGSLDHADGGQGVHEEAGGVVEVDLGGNRDHGGHRGHNVLSHASSNSVVAALTLLDESNSLVHKVALGGFVHEGTGVDHGS